MLIITKSKAQQLIKNGCRCSRFDRGKYKWTGTIKNYVGMEVPDYEGIIAVFAEQRKDRFGKYVALMAVHK